MKEAIYFIYGNTLLFLIDILISLPIKYLGALFIFIGKKLGLLHEYIEMWIDKCTTY